MMRRGLKSLSNASRWWWQSSPSRTKSQPARLRERSRGGSHRPTRCRRVPVGRRTAGNCCPYWGEFTGSQQGQRANRGPLWLKSCHGCLSIRRCEESVLLTMRFHFNRELRMSPRAAGIWTFRRLFSSLLAGACWYPWPSSFCHIRRTWSTYPPIPRPNISASVGAWATSLARHARPWRLLLLIAWLVLVCCCCCGCAGHLDFTPLGLALRIPCSSVLRTTGAGHSQRC